MLNFPDMFALSCTLLYAANFRHRLSVRRPGIGLVY